MKDLLSVVPRPRRLPLGGRTFTLSEFRLADLATVEAWLRDRAPSPLDAVRDGAFGMEPGKERDDLVRATFLAQEHWPPRFGSPEAERLLSDGPGVRFSLTLALARHQPGLTGADVDAVFASVTAAEYRAAERFCWADHPLDELARLIDGPPPDRPDGGPLNWAKCFVSLTQEYPWLSFEAFARLTLTQFVILRSGGQLEPAELRPGEDFMAFARRRSAFFNPEEGAGQASPPGR